MDIPAAMQNTMPMGMFSLYLLGISFLQSFDPCIGADVAMITRLSLETSTRLKRLSKVAPRMVAAAPHAMGGMIIPENKIKQRYMISKENANIPRIIGMLDFFTILYHDPNRLI